MAIADFNHIKTVLNTLDTLRPARFGYTESAVAATGANEITALTGVYVPEDSTQVNSIPTPDLIGVDPLIVNIGLRSQAASLTRMTANHFFGRLGLNLLKVTEKTKLLVEDHLVNRYITPSGDIMEDVTIEYKPDEITLIKHKSPLSASAPITSSAVVSLLAAIYDSNAGVMTGADKKKLDDTAANLNLSGLTSGRLLRYNSVSGRIESATVAETSGALSGVTTLSMSGAITGATTTNTINGLIINSGALSGATTLSMSGAITGATTVNTINGLIINSGALSGITTLSLSGILTSTNTTDGASGVGSIATSGGIYAAKNIYSSGRVTGNTTTGYGIYGVAGTTGQGVRGESATGYGVIGIASGAGMGVFGQAYAAGAYGVYASSTSGTALYVDGVSTFSADATINGLTVGRGGGGIDTNNVCGTGALVNNTTGKFNTCFGGDTLSANLGGLGNTAFGRKSQFSGTSASNNTSLGYLSLYYNIDGNNNVAIGESAASYHTNTSNQLTSAIQSIFIGSGSKASANGNQNEIAIGYNALGNGSNSVTLGNTSITKTILRGNVGIGTASPSGKLHIIGVSGTTVIYGQTSNSPNNSAQPFITAHTGNALYPARIDLVRGSYSSTTGWAFVTSNGGTPTERMRIDPAGNVAIGSTDPETYKLHVTGNIYATETITAAGAITGTNLVYLTGAQSIAGIKTFSDTTDATSSTAGGTVVSGGLAVAKRICAGNLTTMTEGAILGQSYSNFGVIGESVTGDGVLGVTSTPGRAGVHGYTATAGVHGVRGEANNPTSGYGVYGTSVSNAGVYGVSTSSLGVKGECSGGIGVKGESTSGTGIYGSSTSGTAIYGASTDGPGIYGISMNNYCGRFIGGLGVRISTLAGTGNRAVYSDANGVLTNSSSDITLKTNIREVKYGLKETLQMNPILFNWIDTEKMGEQDELGFSAQQIQEIIPEVVGTNADDTLSLDYPKLIPVLINAIKELKSEIDQLKKSKKL